MLRVQALLTLKTAVTLADSSAPHSCGPLCLLVDYPGKSPLVSRDVLRCVLQFFEKRGDLAFVLRLAKLKGLREGLLLGGGETA